MHDAALTAAMVLASAFDTIRCLAVSEATIANFEERSRKKERKRGEASNGPCHTGDMLLRSRCYAAQDENHPSSAQEIEAELEDCPPSTVTRMA